MGLGRTDRDEGKMKREGFHILAKFCPCYFLLAPTFSFLWPPL